MNKLWYKFLEFILRENEETLPDRLTAIKIWWSEIGTKWYATLMLQDQGYGGSEEGGWWFDTFQRIDDPLNKSFWFEASANRYIQKVMIGYIDRLNEGRPEITSVLGYGRYTWYLTKGEALPMYPEQRPHYE